MKQNFKKMATAARVLAADMIEQAKLNPNAKLAAAMKKKTGDGFEVDGANVQGSIGILPAGAILPVKIDPNLTASKCISGY